MYNDIDCFPSKIKNIICQINTLLHLQISYKAISPLLSLRNIDKILVVVNRVVTTTLICYIFLHFIFRKDKYIYLLIHDQLLEVL